MEPDTSANRAHPPAGKENDDRPVVVVIGAGPSGLLCVRHVREVASVRAFEYKSEPGGMWVYSDVNEHSHGSLESDPYYKLYGNLHSSLYDGLLTNIPNCSMTFKGFPHAPDTPYILPSADFQK